MLSKAEKSLLARTDIFYFAGTLTVTFAQVLSLLYILRNKRKLSNYLILTSLLLLSIFTGDRSNVIIYIMVFLSINETNLSFKKIIVIGPMALLFVVYWKAVYYEIIQTIFFQKQFGLYGYIPNLSLSSVEFISATNILAHTIINQSKDLLLGFTYFVTPLILAVPRFLFDTGVNTLAESFIQKEFPIIAANGGAMGFSIIAESIMNFGFIGPIIIGIFWGLIASILDNRKKDIFFIIGFFMFVKLFRSDFASLIKNYLIVFGSISAVFGFILYFSKILINNFKIMVINNKYKI